MLAKVAFEAAVYRLKDVAFSNARPLLRIVGYGKLNRTVFLIHQKRDVALGVSRSLT